MMKGSGSSAFLPSDRWGRNMTGYTSETKQREEAAGVLSSGAVGCTLLVLSAVCYAYAFPTVGENVIDGAASLIFSLYASLALRQ